MDSNEVQTCTLKLLYSLHAYFSTNNRACEAYSKTSTQSICDTYLTELDHVYTCNQSEIHTLMVKLFELGLTPECYEPISRALCTYYYPKCGYNGTVHVPMTLCSDVCEYVSKQCSATWLVFQSYINSASFGFNDNDYQTCGSSLLRFPECNNTGIKDVNLTNNCCISGGIILPEGILC